MLYLLFTLLIAINFSAATKFAHSQQHQVQHNGIHSLEAAFEEHIVEPPIHNHLGYIMSQRSEVLNEEMGLVHPAKRLVHDESVVTAQDLVPGVSKAVFSNDGRYVILSFNTLTDKGGFSYNFPCRSLFSFSGDNNATCYWTDSSTVTIYPNLKDTNNILNVASLIFLAIGDYVINTVCPVGARDCVPTMLFPQTFNVFGPDVPVIPTIIFNAPNAISSCASWTVDLTATTGDGGRAWKSVGITVTSETGSAVRFLKGNFTDRFRTDKPFTIPSGAFVVGSQYTVTVSLCNFLQSCGSSSITLDIRTTGATPPVASIVGSTTRTLFTTNSFSLTGSGYVLTCSGAQDSSSISYDWFVANGTGAPTVIPGLTSASRNPNNFLLNPYTIQGTGKYFVALTVTDKRTKLSTQVLVTVNVLASPIVAAISPSSQQLVKVGRSVTLSGQNSFDPDALALGSNELRFLWRCTELTSAAAACADSFTWKNVTTTRSRVELSPTNAAVGGVYLIRMTAIKGRRNTTASVSIQVLEGNAPLITILTPASLITSVNPISRILVSARVLSNFSCVANWSTTYPNLRLSSAVLIPTTAVVQPRVPTIVNLFLASNALPPQSTFTFYLACERTRASVVVTTNGPPVGGFLTVTNSEDGSDSGIELQDVFEFVTAQWSDADIPITYTFGFITPSTGSMSVFQSRSEVPFASTTLPGSPKLLSLVLVYDALNCSTSANQTLSVKSLPTAQVQSLILQKLNNTQGSTSIDSIKAVISVASASLSSVNCSLVSKTYCANLNRAPCGTVSQLCGSCLSGFIGDSGEGNSRCYNQTLVNRGINNVPDTCSANSPCPPFYSCESGTCVAVQKTCPFNCNKNGDCQFLDSNTRAVLTTCPVVSTTCIASCNCKEGFSGSTCATSSADLSSNQKLRYLLLSGLSTVVNYEDATNETVSSAVTSMSSLVQTPLDLNADSVPIFQTISQNALISALYDPTIELSSIAGLLSASNVAVQAQASYTGNGPPPNSTSPLDFASQVIASYNSVLARQQVAGQDAITNIFDSFRTSAVDLSLTDSNNITLSVPLSNLEVATGAPVTSISTTIKNSSIEEVNIQVSQFSASLVTPANNSKVLSHVIQFTVEKASEPVIVKIANFDTVKSERQLNFTSQCLGKTDTRILNYTCPKSGYVIVHDCTGRTGPMTSQCPVHNAQCNFVNMTGSNPFSAKGICEVVEVTEKYTTCSCLTNLTTINNQLEGRRKLLSADEVAYQSGVYNIIAMSEYTTDELITTFNAAPAFTTTEAVSQVITVIVMFGVLWVGGLLIVFGTVWRQQKSKSKHEEKKNILIRAVEKNPPSNRNMKESLVRYVRSVFPSVFYQDNWLMQLKEEILKNHMYLILLTAPKGEMEDKKRIISGVRLLTVQTCLMCLLAIFYDLQSPSDDGSCDTILTEDSCLSRKSILDDSQTYCQWNTYASDLPDGTCSFNNLNITFKTALYVQVIVSVISLFIMKPVDICFDTLLAPTEKEIKIIRSKEHALESSFYASSMISTGVRRLSALLTGGGGGGGRGSVQPLQPSQLNQLENKKKMKKITSVRQISEAVQRNHIVAQAILKSQTFKLDSSIKIPNANEISDHFDLDGLIEMIFRQRELLKPEELEMFDLSWGIENVNVIQADVGTTYRPVHYQITPEVKEKMKKHIEHIEEEYLKLKTKINDQTVTHSQRGLEVLYEFILDLLGRDTPAAKIFRAKSEEDFQQFNVVGLPIKLFAGFIVVCLNGFFIYYSLLRGFVRGQQWQHDYLVACIIQFIAEVFLFQTMECVWINFIVPNLVSKQVHHTHEIIEHLVERVCNRIRTDGSNGIDYLLNSAEYLFVSKKLAANHPTLIESILVFSYSNHLPGEVCRKWLPPEQSKIVLHEDNYLPDEEIERNISIRQKYQNRHKTWKDIGIIASFLITLQIIGTFPFFIQKMIVRFVQPFFYGGMVNAFQIIFNSTIYTIVFVILLLIILGFIGMQLIVAQKKKARVGTPSSHRRSPSTARDSIPIAIAEKQQQQHGRRVRVAPAMATPAPVTLELAKQEEAENRQPLLDRARAHTISNEDSKGEELETKSSEETRTAVDVPKHRKGHGHAQNNHQKHQHNKDGEGKDGKEHHKEHRHHHGGHHEKHHSKGEGKSGEPAATSKTPQRITIRHEGMKGLSRKDRKNKQEANIAETTSTVSTIQVPRSTNGGKSDQIREADRVDGSVTSGSLEEGMFSAGFSSLSMSDGQK